MKIDQRLERIAPLWFKRIKRVRTVKGLLRKQTVRNGLTTATLDIEAYGCCMVGESYGFTRGYEQTLNQDNCSECEKYSNRVVISPRYPNRTDAERRFQETIKEFLDHIELEHGVNLQE